MNDEQQIKKSIMEQDTEEHTPPNLMLVSCCYTCDYWASDVYFRCTKYIEHSPNFDYATAEAYICDDWKDDENGNQTG